MNIEFCHILIVLFLLIVEFILIITIGTVGICALHDDNIFVKVFVGIPIMAVFFFIFYKLLMFGFVDLALMLNCPMC